MTEKLIANSKDTFEESLAKITSLWGIYHYLRISINPGMDRSLDQNAMFFELFTHIADWFYGGDIELARAECKLDFGLPILRRDDEQLNDLCGRSIDLLSREDQLAFIVNMSITSDMSRPQATECINKIMDTFADRGLLWPDYLTRDKRKPKARPTKQHNINAEAQRRVG
jgi:hypothetical protein